MQASEIEQLDNKSFNRWCEVSLPKVLILVFFFDLFTGFFCKCIARNHVFDACSSIIEYSFQNPTMNLTVNSTN